MNSSTSTDQYSCMDTLPRVPLPVGSVEELLSLHAQNVPQKAALIAVDVDTGEADTVSYKQLYALVRRTASWLSSLGVERGDRFAVHMHNAAEILILELAGGVIGAATVPLDVKRDTPERISFKLHDTNAKVLLTKAELQLPYPTYLPTYHWSTFHEFTNLLPASPTPRPIGTLSDTYVILYTSGTTARPKGVLLSVRACLLNALGIVEWQKFTAEDVFNIVLPLHHINSTEFSLAMILVGGTIVLNSRYSASSFWHVVSRFRATNTSIVPTILHDLLMRADEFKNEHPDVSSLKRICIGSAPVLPEETLRFYDTLGIRVIQGYGQTETALRVAGVPIDVDESTYRDLVKSNTIGVELANNHLAIMDENNTPMQEGQEGEICIAGPVLADGYLNDPDETAKSFKNGWFHSGDLGYWKKINGKKYFFIIGRIKEIIIKGGVNLSPSAIEDALLKAFPQIEEVSVVGYPDERMGEEIAAVVVSKKKFALPDAIPGLSAYETPKKIFFVENLPKTSTGKIQRVEVKKMVANLIKNERSKHYYVRRIDAEERGVVKKALEINNARFPYVPSTLKEFTTRAQNGFLFGVFEEHEGLVGSLSCVRVFHPEKLTTWNEAVRNHNINGDTLVCVAISVTPRSPNSPVPPVNGTGGEEVLPGKGTLIALAKKYIEDYVVSGNDHVLNFHKKSKGGIPGATVWKILENGRPGDEEAMGYAVIMKYPTITDETKIVRSNAPTPAVLLMEHALLWAKKHRIKTVLAFSRPAGFRAYLKQLSRV